MIGTIDVCPQTYSPDFPLVTLKSFVNSPSSIRIRNVPKKVGKWRITNVFVTVAYPDNTTRTIECVLTGGVYVATFEGCSSTGKVEKGLTISANGKDENDNDVTGYVLGKGDVEILEARENTSPGETVYYIHLLEDEPDVPTDGDMYKKDGNYVVYQNGVETQLGVSQENMESYVDQKVDEAVEEMEGEIPTKTSDLTNDSGFITSADVPTKTSDLTNDSGFITSGDLRYDLYEVPANLQLKDRAINYKSTVGVATSFQFVIPSATSTTKCRDFLLLFNIFSTSTIIPTVSFIGATDFYIDGDTFPAPDSTGIWLYSFTEIITNNFVVSLKKLTKAT